MIAHTAKDAGSPGGHSHHTRRKPGSLGDSEGVLPPPGLSSLQIDDPQPPQGQLTCLHPTPSYSISF